MSLSNKKKYLSAITALVLLSLPGVSMPAVAEDIDNDKAMITVEGRFAGVDRYGTSVEVSKGGFLEGTDTVLLASGENFPDALSATASAAKVDASLLLTKNSEVPQSVIEEIKRLSPKEIILVGEIQSLNAGVEKTARSLTEKVTRIGGADRYETSLNLTKHFFKDTPGHLYITTGEDFPDALTAGALAGSKQAPLILVPGKDTLLKEQTKTLLKELAAPKAQVIGGSNSVSEELIREIKGITPQVERLAGTTRYDTGIAVAKTWNNPKEVLTASGDTYPDALTGSVLAAKQQKPLIIGSKYCGDGPFNRPLLDMGVKTATIIGGTNTFPSYLLTGTTCEEYPMA